MELIADSVGSLNPRSEAGYINNLTRIHLYRTARAFVLFVHSTLTILTYPTTEHFALLWYRPVYPQSLTMAIKIPNIYNRTQMLIFKNSRWGCDTNFITTTVRFDLVFYTLGRLHLHEINC